MKRSRIAETDLNVKPAQRLLRGADGPGSAGRDRRCRGSPGGRRCRAGSAAIVWLNRDFYRFLGRRKGSGFAAASVPLHLLYYCCCGVSVLIALFQWHVLSRLPASFRPEPLAASGSIAARSRFPDRSWLESQGG